MTQGNKKSRVIVEPVRRSNYKREYEMTTKSYAEVDRTLGVALDHHAEHARQVEDLSARLKAADGDRAAALKAYISTSDDAAVVKLRAGIEKLTAQLNDLAEKNVVSETLSEDDKAKLTEQLATVRAEFNTGRKAILSITESMAAVVNVDAVKAALEEIGSGIKSTRGRKAGDPGSSLPKASAVLQVSNGNDSWTFQTFGDAAKVIFPGDAKGVEKLQLAFAKAAGVEHKNISDVSTSQTFELYKEEDGSAGDFAVKTQPKERKKPGPRPGGNKQ